MLTRAICRFGLSLYLAICLSGCPAPSEEGATTSPPSVQKSPISLADLIDYYLPDSGQPSDFKYNRYHATVAFHQLSPPQSLPEPPYTTYQFLIVRLEGSASASVPENIQNQDDAADARFVFLHGMGSRLKWLTLRPYCEGDSPKPFLSDCKVDFSSLSDRFKMEELCQGRTFPFYPYEGGPKVAPPTYKVWRISSHYRHRNAYLLISKIPDLVAIRIEDTDSSVAPKYSIPLPETCVSWLPLIQRGGIRDEPLEQAMDK